MNGVKFLLDTNIIIGLYERHPDTLDLLKVKQVTVKECAYSAITRITQKIGKTYILNAYNCSTGK